MHLFSRNALRGVPFFLSLLLPTGIALHAQVPDLDSILGRAQTEQSSGQYAAAAADYGQATAMQSDIPELWANRGLMEYFAEQKPQAISSFRHALALKPGLLTAMLFLGKAYIDTGKPAMALPLLKRAHTLHAADGEVLLALGDAYQAMNNPGSAASAYRQAAAIDPAMTTAWFGLGVSALAVIEDSGRVLAGTHAQSIWAQALYADELFAQGRSQEGITAYEQGIHSASPADAATLATTLRRVVADPARFGVPADTATIFKDLLPQLSAKGQATQATACPTPENGSAGPRTAAVLRRQSACSFWQGDFENSAEAAGLLLTIAPGDPEALYWSIKANERRAVAALSRFEELAPQSAASSDIVGDLYRRRRQPAEALQEYQKALAIDPHDPGAHLGIAAVYFSDGNTEGTISAAQAGLADRPDDVRLNLLMAEALVAQHAYPDAKPYLQKCLSAPPELILRVHALLGKIESSQGNTAEAISQLKLALPGDEDGSIHYQLYRLYRQTGNLADAEKAEAASKTLREQRMKHATTAVESSLAGDH